MLQDGQLISHCYRRSTLRRPMGKQFSSRSYLFLRLRIKGYHQFKRSKNKATAGLQTGRFDNIDSAVVFSCVSIAVQKQKF